MHMLACLGLTLHGVHARGTETRSQGPCALWGRYVHPRADRESRTPARLRRWSNADVRCLVSDLASSPPLTPLTSHVPGPRKSNGSRSFLCAVTCTHEHPLLWIKMCRLTLSVPSLRPSPLNAEPHTLFAHCRRLFARAEVDSIAVGTWQWSCTSDCCRTFCDIRPETGVVLSGSLPDAIGRLTCASRITAVYARCSSPGMCMAAVPARTLCRRNTPYLIPPGL